ncbi:MAG: hypothetical protein A3K61_07905 [Thaumarchaeota archaeon RBG_16_49_8]|nr:hypothetical protein [Nitrososphaerota archaeon]OHE53159.1 MAG: hypothetical protein A3K61_07905 [Thaumarchaeota archaeon RBG_16_49_8]
MIPFDLMVAYLGGALLALGAREQLRREESLFFNKPLFYSLLWITFIYVPSAMFFFHGWTDWNVMYAFDSAQNMLLSSVVIRLDAMALILTFLFSFIFAHKQIRKSKEQSVLISMVAAVIIFGSIIFGLYDRSFFIAPFEQWTQGKGEWLFASLLFYSNLVAAFTDLGPLAYLYLKFSREGEKLKTQPSEDK